MAPQFVVAFDLYGTLLSTESIAKQLATFVGESKASKISTTWRKYQLEYTWRLNSMGRIRACAETRELSALELNDHIFFRGLRFVFKHHEELSSTCFGGKRGETARRGYTTCHGRVRFTFYIPRC